MPENSRLHHFVVQNPLKVEKLPDFFPADDRLICLIWYGNLIYPVPGT
jgi:hypothetical protein